MRFCPACKVETLPQGKSLCNHCLIKQTTNKPEINYEVEAARIESGLKMDAEKARMNKNIDYTEKQKNKKRKRRQKRKWN